MQCRLALNPCITTPEQFGLLIFLWEGIKESKGGFFLFFTLFYLKQVLYNLFLLSVSPQPLSTPPEEAFTGCSPPPMESQEMAENSIKDCGFHDSSSTK